MTAIKLKVKIISGFRKDQEDTIDMSEAHKAYYLFLNPNERGVFSTGLAIKGSDIQKIVPDFNSTMGWNPCHQLDSYDYAELRSKGIDRKMRDLLFDAKELAAIPGAMDKPLLESRTLFLNKTN